MKQASFYNTKLYSLRCTPSPIVTPSQIVLTVIIPAEMGIDSPHDDYLFLMVPSLFEDHRHQQSWGAIRGS